MINGGDGRKAGSPTERRHDPISSSPAGGSMVECSLVVGQPYPVLAPRRPPQSHPARQTNMPAIGNVSETTGQKPNSMMTSESGSHGVDKADLFQIPMAGIPSPLHMAAQGRTRQANQKLPMLPPPVPVLATPRAHASTPNAAFALINAAIDPSTAHALSGIQATAIGPIPIDRSAIKDTAAIGMLPPISAPPPMSHPLSHPLSHPATLAARSAAVPAAGAEGHGESGSPRSLLQPKEDAVNEKPPARKTRMGSSFAKAVASSGARADGGRPREKKYERLKAQQVITKTFMVTRSAAKMETKEIKPKPEEAKKIVSKTKKEARPRPAGNKTKGGGGGGKTTRAAGTMAARSKRRK